MTARRGAPAAAAALVVLLTAACSMGGSLRSQLRSWQSGASYAQGQQLLAADLRDIATGLRTGPLAAVKTACDGLGVDAANSYGELPTPDRALTELLNGEYVDFEDAAQACSTAPSLHSKAISHYLSLARRGRRQLTAAKRRIAEILAT